MDNNLDESNIEQSDFNPSKEGLVRRHIYRGLIEYHGITYFSKGHRSLKNTTVLIKADPTDISSIHFKTELDDDYYSAYALYQPRLRGMSLEEWKIIRAVFDGEIPDRLPISNDIKWIIVKKFEDVFSRLGNVADSNVKFHMLSHENIVITQTGVYKRDDPLQEISLDTGKCFDDMSMNLFNGTNKNVGLFVLFYIYCEHLELEASKNNRQDHLLDPDTEKGDEELSKKLKIEPYSSVTFPPYTIMHCDHTEIDLFMSSSENQDINPDEEERSEELSTDPETVVKRNNAPRPLEWVFIDHTDIDLLVDKVDEGDQESDGETENIDPGPS